MLSFLERCTRREHVGETQEVNPKELFFCYAFEWKIFTKEKKHFLFSEDAILCMVPKVV